MCDVSKESNLIPRLSPVSSYLVTGESLGTRLARENMFFLPTQPKILSLLYNSLQQYYIVLHLLFTIVNNIVQRC